MSKYAIAATYRGKWLQLRRAVREEAEKMRAELAKTRESALAAAKTMVETRILDPKAWRLEEEDGDEYPDAHLRFERQALPHPMDDYTFDKLVDWVASSPFPGTITVDENKKGFVLNMNYEKCNAEKTGDLLDKLEDPTKPVLSPLDVQVLAKTLLGVIAPPDWVITVATPAVNETRSLDCFTGKPWETA